MNSSHRAYTRIDQASQRGVVLFVALIVLIVMTLAGLGMLRQMSASNAIAGNIAFKEDATAAADAGTEEARNYIVSNGKANPLLLDTNQPASGYYSTWIGGVDPTQYDWSHAGTTLLESPALSGNTVRFIIHRLCETDGLDPNDPAQRCSDLNQQSGATRGNCGYAPCPPPPPVPYYRITTRVDGPRNTTSYTEVLMY